MRPEARIKAALDILADIFAGKAADRALKDWGSQNRYAGGGDRRAVAAHVYAAIRAGQTLKPRAAMLLGLKAQGLADQADALFSGVGYGPDPLTPDERAILAGDVKAEGLSGWLADAFQLAFGAAAEEEYAALMQRAPLDLRINTLKASPDIETVLAAEGIVVETVPGAPLALRVTDGAAQVGSSQAYHDGLIEIQDAGSQIISALADAQPGMKVLDLCAGAGGKALALAAAMQNSGHILACDTGPQRLDRLQPRAARAGVSIIETRHLDPDWLDAPSPFETLFDLVIVDAPCSGSGTWRRNPETRLLLTEAKVAALTHLQSRLLDAAAGLVRPGGHLAYMTCSVLPQENEGVSDGFLARTTSFAGLGHNMRLSPHSMGTDGFFCARFHRAPQV